MSSMLIFQDVTNFVKSSHDQNVDFAKQKN